MISTLLDRLFQRQNITSGTQVKQRLKFILAHDRAAIEPQVFDNMRHEIMRVVSKYVELDEGSLDIRLESDKRMTALIANLPIKMVREDLPDLVALFDEPNIETNLVDNSQQADPVALEMDQFAEEALDAIAAKEKTKSPTENPDPENSTELAERTTEVTSKLRNAANKSQNLEPDKSIKPTITITDTPKDTSTTTSENLVENSIASINNDTDELEEQSSDQLELSLNLPESSESSDLVSEQSPEVSNQSSE